MREIKFRGKHKNPYGDKWVYGYYALEDGEHVIVMPHSTSYEEALKEKRPISPISVRHTVDYNTIGQYTGLKDANGEEIYEDDIIYVIPEDQIAFILWDKETARYIIQFEGWCVDFDNYYGKELEVIGNIWDNLELLEEKE